MMSSLRNLNAITAVQNIELQQINDSTKTVISKNRTYEKDTNLNNISNNKISKDNVKDNFKNLLNQVKNNESKTEVVKDKKITTVNDVKNKTDKKINEIEEELEEKIENLNDEQLVQCLSILVDFLNNNLSSMMNTDLDNLSDNLKDNLIEILNSVDLSNELIAQNVSDNGLFEKSQEIFSNLLELLNKSDVVEKIDADTLKFTEKLLSQISAKLNDETINNTVNNSALTEVINETTNKLNELLNSTLKNENELSLQNNSLNNIYKVIENNSSNNTSDNSDSQNYSTSDSKDDKVLQSILGEKSTEPTVPVFTATTTVVNNGTGAVIETTQTVNVKTMATDIVQNVKYMASNDMREMIVKVNPGNLGEITIRLVEEDGAMKLHMKAVSKETYSLLVQQSSDIKNQLSDQNIKIHDVNISLYEEDTTFFKDGEFSKSFDGQNDKKGNEKAQTTQGSLEDNIDSDDENYDSNALDMLV